jgi:hypothetical protein
MQKHALCGNITQLKTSLTVNNNTIELNSFTQKYIANVLYGIARSFEIYPETIMVCVDAEGFRVYTDKGEIDVSKKDFAKQLIESTIRGMLSPLKGVFWMQNIVITSNILEHDLEPAQGI